MSLLLLLNKRVGMVYNIIMVGYECKIFCEILQIQISYDNTT